MARIRREQLKGAKLFWSVLFTSLAEENLKLFVKETI